VIDAPEQEGFGDVNVLAMSSPIYALEFVVLDTKEAKAEEVWEEMTPADAPRVKAADVVEANGTKWIRPDMREPVTRPPADFVPPPGVRIREIIPEPFDR
jgi:hypothetical protein